MKAKEVIDTLLELETIFRCEGSEQSANAMIAGANAIRAQQKRENPQPLTLEQLKKMNDERVFIKFPFAGMWALVSYHTENECEYDAEDGDNVWLTNNLGGRDIYEDILKDGGIIYDHEPHEPKEGKE